MFPEVSIVSCVDYDRDAVFSAVKKTVDLIGGIKSIIKSGERVLLKPNLLKGKLPDAAVTTHPEILRAAIRLVREAGAHPYVGDSPGIGNLRRVCEKAGILAVLEEEKTPLVEFEEVVVLKSSGRFQRFEIAKAAADADAIINLPKLKTHGMTTLTGAVKNMFGCIPGRRKVQWHFSTGVDHAAFMRMLVELSLLLKPRLTIMDAVVAMEGNGPGSGDPTQVGVVVGSRDIFALDAVSASIVGLPPDALPVLRVAKEIGAGEIRLDHIQILGLPIASVQVKHFRIPPIEHLEWKLPEWAKRKLKNAITTRPIIDHDICIKCGICKRDCPQQAISEIHNKLVIDYRNCIRCFCCQEFCPKGAITVGKGWMLKLART